MVKQKIKYNIFFYKKYKNNKIENGFFKCGYQSQSIVQKILKTKI